MPKEIPGFYYDAAKNRYFPLRGPIPGSSSSSATRPRKQHIKRPTQAARRTSIKLLKSRELNGSQIAFGKKRCHFVEEYRKKHASQPTVWKYQETASMGDIALDHMQVFVQTSEGQTESDILVTGSSNGCMSLFEVGKVGEHFNDSVKFIPECVWPGDHIPAYGEAPSHLWKLFSLQFASRISCIKFPGKHFPRPTGDASRFRDVLITTLGSGPVGGCVRTLNLKEPFDFSQPPATWQMVKDVVSLDCTIWTADCNPNPIQAVIGTNRGAAVVDLERRAISWVCRSSSDILAQQLDQSGNVVLCGLRNGAIVTVDVRQKQERCAATVVTQKVPFPPGHHHTSSEQLLKLKGNIYPSCTMYMPSSICCLISLQMHDQYFLASSMDGSINLYDHRMIKRGPVQSYEGHVNSHHALQLEVDKSESFLLGGGEDCKIRLWSLKSGEMLFEEKIPNEVPSTVCWQSTERFAKIKPDQYKSFVPELQNGLGAWCGSREGIYYMSWP
ncbi:hypothetical protein K2173_020516 [Erythroxylum novogranatense]|uniref:Uncharacterized protein n=1 Tax=Erythroxylum novogranatense TaxID=1862640 RepID=A0AAV8TGT3_9ROSI|nr:hypothetical protein K2173_020516 [Erythroxylum novogranatense]